jgi:hypothetical protein
LNNKSIALDKQKRLGHCQGVFVWAIKPNPWRVV